MDIIAPTIREDAEKIIDNIKWYFHFIDFKELIIVTNEETISWLKRNETETNNIALNIKPLLQDDVINYNEVLDYFSLDLGCENIKNKAGWYYQQFLKMGYARICSDEHYLLWDSDTIPLREYCFSTDDGCLFFDVKDEYNPPYFETIRNLFNMSRGGNYSFISEHMIINTQIMREVLDELEKNGKPFWQTILDAVPREYLSESGFSEYETYGTYVINRHPKDYAIRQWTSLRQGTQFFDYNRMKKHDVDWLGKWFDAVSFEKNDTIGNHRKWLYRNRVLQRLFTFEQLVECERLYDRLRYEVRNLWKKQ